MDGHVVPVCTTLSYLCQTFHGILLYQANDFLRSCFTVSAVVPQSNQLNFIKSAGGGREMFKSSCHGAQLPNLPEALDTGRKRHVSHGKGRRFVQVASSHYSTPISYTIVFTHEAGHPTRPQRNGRHERERVSLGHATVHIRLLINFKLRKYPREWVSKYHMPYIRLTLRYITPCLLTLVVVYQPTMSSSAIEWPVPKSETVPRPVKVSNPFCFEDSQVVFQASHSLPPVILLSF